MTVVTELAPCNLFTYVASHPSMPFSSVLHVFDSILSGLSALHSQGVEMSHLVPSNVVIFADGTVKLMHWGLIRFHREYANDVYVLPQYYPPEHMDRYNRSRPLVRDCWKAAALTVEMMQGSFPKLCSGAAFAVRRFFTYLPAVDSCPGFFHNVLLECLVDEPKVRKTSVEILDLLRSSAPPGYYYPNGGVVTSDFY